MNHEESCAAVNQHLLELEERDWAVALVLPCRVEIVELNWKGWFRGLPSVAHALRRLLQNESLAGCNA